MLNLPLIENVDLQPHQLESVDTNLCVKNYVLFSEIENSLHVVLSQRHLAPAFDYLAKQTFTYPIILADDDS